MVNSTKNKIPKESSSLFNNIIAASVSGNPKPKKAKQQSKYVDIATADNIVPKNPPEEAAAKRKSPKKK